MMKYPHSLYFIFLTLFLACSTEKDSHLISITGRNCILNVSDIFEAYELMVSPEIAVSIGGNISDFYVVDSTIILASVESKSIVRLGFDGQVKWQMMPDESILNRFSDFNLVNYNEKRKLLEVYNPNEFKIFYYDLNGRFVDKEEIAFDFTDRETIGNDGSNYLYDASIFSNEHIWGEGETFKLFIARKDSVISTYFEDVPLSDDEVSFIDDNSFQVYERSIFYMEEFDHSVYLFDEANSLRFDHEIVYDVPVTSHDVLMNDGLKDKFSHILDEGIPYTLQSIRVGNRIIAITDIDSEQFLTLVEEGNEVSKVGKYLSINGRVFPSPSLYSNGYFMSIFPSYVNQYLLEAENVSASELTEKIDEMIDIQGDRSSVRMVFFAPKKR